jgi:hypothetical protein
MTIPATVRFADLNLSRTPAGEVAFDWSPIEAICAASGIDINVFRRQHEDNVSGLITQWYAAARANGEPPDPTQELMIAEALSECN